MLFHTGSLPGVCAIAHYPLCTDVKLYNYFIKNTIHKSLQHILQKQLELAIFYNNKDGKWIPAFAI